MKKIFFTIIILGLFCLSSCKKDELMKDSERQLLTELKNTEILKKGKIVITVKNYYYYCYYDGDLNGKYSVDYSDWNLAQFYLRYCPNLYLFGYTDLVSNYANIRKNSINVLSESEYLYTITTRTGIDSNNFYVFTDNRTKFFSKKYLALPIDNNIPFQSFINGNYKAGDVLLVQFLPPSETPDLSVSWTETIIHCENLPYISLVELFNNKKVFIKSLTYDITDINYIDKQNQSIPKQQDNPILIMKNSIFGNTKADTLNPSAFVTDRTKNPSIIDIPLKIYSEGLEFQIPMSMDINTHKFYFLISY